MMQEEESISCYTDSTMPRVSILGEIVGATNLVAALRRRKNEDEPTSQRKIDSVSSFVKVYWGDEMIHQTSCITNDNNPIWTCDTGSLFLISQLHGCVSRDLRLEVFDMLGKSEKELIGIVTIPGEDIISDEVCNEQRIHYRIEKENIDHKEEKHERLTTKLWNNFRTAIQFNSEANIMDGIDADDSIYGKSVLTAESFAPSGIDDDFIFGKDGIISMRFRVATKDDLRFLEDVKIYKRGYSYAKRINNLGVTNIIDGKALAHLITEKSTAYVETVNCDLLNEVIDFRCNGEYIDTEGVQRLRVKPCPDPTDQDRTRFLTHDEMEERCQEPSHSWVEAGSGSLGQVKVEILSCEGLPNKDIVKLFGNKTDPFVSLVYEDCLVQTDRLSDCLSPMWMPWTQRAFVFNRMHALSSIYIGVFNHEIGPFKHHGCGRVTVDLREFQPNTVYTLKYELFSSPVLTKRKSKGTITIRLQISDFNHKNTILSVLSPPMIHVNVKRRKTLAIARYTCYGKRREDVYNMNVLKSYIDEILEYIERFSFEIQMGINSLIFWRGQVRLWKWNIPLHSMLAFISATYIIERPHLVPAYFFFCIAWIMIVLMFRRRYHPSPWHRSKSFFHHLRSFMPFLPTTRSKGVSIDKYEGFNETIEMDESRKMKIEQDKILQSRIAAFRTELQEILSALSEIHLDTTQDRGSFNPLSRLLPLQLLLRDIIFYIRWVKVILSCNDSQISFLVTSSCIGIGLLLSIFPVVRIFHWACRISIWLFLGPWMKLIDISYSRRKSCEHKVNKHVKKMMDEIQTRERKRWYEARVSKEEALKLKATRTLRFGRFAVRVPSANIIRHHDYPLPQSFARPLGSTEGDSDVRVENFIPGQKHFGVMIPQLAKSRKERQLEKKLRERKIMKVRQKYSNLGDQRPHMRRVRNKMRRLFDEGDPTMVLCASSGGEDACYQETKPPRQKSVRFSVQTFESDNREGFELVPAGRRYQPLNIIKDEREDRDDLCQRFNDDVSEEFDDNISKVMILPSPSGNPAETMIETTMSDITAYNDTETVESIEIYSIFD